MCGSLSFLLSPPAWPLPPPPGSCPGCTRSGELLRCPSCLWSLVVGAPGGWATPGSPAAWPFSQGLRDQGNPARRDLGTVQGRSWWGCGESGGPFEAPLPAAWALPPEPKPPGRGSAGSGRSPPCGFPGTAPLRRRYLLLVGSQTLPRWGQALSCPSFVFQI